MKIYTTYCFFGVRLLVGSGGREEREIELTDVPDEKSGTSFLEVFSGKQVFVGVVLRRKKADWRLVL